MLLFTPESSMSDSNSDSDSDSDLTGRTVLRRDRPRDLGADRKNSIAVRLSTQSQNGKDVLEGPLMDRAEWGAGRVD